MPDNVLGLVAKGKVAGDAACLRIFQTGASAEHGEKQDSDKYGK
ncbi:hypothetical protein [Geomobilimonas luticola]|nr:hypothetical protein [Geomobilimonas luticola]